MSRDNCTEFTGVAYCLLAANQQVFIITHTKCLGVDIYY